MSGRTVRLTCAQVYAINALAPRIIHDRDTTTAEVLIEDEGDGIVRVFLLKNSRRAREVRVQPNGETERLDDL